MTDIYAKNFVYHQIDDWLKENEKHFIPPVCNKMMQNTQLKVFYVGGPNQRKDYHLEEGEEFFYMRKGNMCLKVLVNGQFKDIHIREGEVFLLPGKIPHSPQRSSDTVGLVIERDRTPDETDALRYFVEGSRDILYERWFHCVDLGSQLGPVIKDFFASEQYATGKPIKEDLNPSPPWTPDSKRLLEGPFYLKDWIRDNRLDLEAKGSLPLWKTELYQSDIFVLGFGSGKRELESSDGETMLWLVEGDGVGVSYGKDNFTMKNDSLLFVPKGIIYVFDPKKNSAVLSIKMYPNQKKRIRL